MTLGADWPMDRRTGGGSVVRRGGGGNKSKQRHGDLSLERSAGAVAAALEDALLEEVAELADVVLGEVGGAVGSQRRAGGGEQHPEQVPQVALARETQTDRQTDDRRISRAGRRTWGVSRGVAAALPPGGCAARPPSARLGSRKASLEGTRELPAGGGGKQITRTFS